TRFRTRPNSRNTSEHCDFHKQDGHSTAECRYLQSLFLPEYGNGYIRLPTSEETRANYTYIRP
ncbi:unnamed protein product, partial [Cochlearia groenlandica]